MPYLCFSGLLGVAVVALAATGKTCAAEPAQSPAPTNTPAIQVSERALRLHRSAPVIDGHNDFPWELREKGGGSFEQVDISKSAPGFQTDIPRLRKGGVGAQFWAAYVPAETRQSGASVRMTLEQIDLIHRMVERYPADFAMAGTANDVMRIRKKGRIACLIGVEGGHSIDNSLGVLRMYYALGVRYMTLTHADNVGWADAATDAPQCNGLTDFGRQVVHEMNRLGMLVDISHVSAATMNAALDFSRAPVIASHSSAFAVAPHARNVPDAVLKRIRQNGGVVMVNFFSGFVVPESARIMAGMFDVTRELRKQHPAVADYRKAIGEWRKAHPMPSGTVKELVDHIDHIVKVAGIDHVGLGSDFDGVSQVPAGIEDVSKYPAITQELLNRGYSERQIRKVLGENIVRALGDAEKVAAQMRRAGR